MYPLFQNAVGTLVLGKVKYTGKLKMYVTDGDIQYSTSFFFTEKGNYTFIRR